MFSKTTILILAILAALCCPESSRFALANEPDRPVDRYSEDRYREDRYSEDRYPDFPPPNRPPLRAAAREDIDEGRDVPRREAKPPVDDGRYPLPAPAGDRREEPVPPSPAQKSAAPQIGSSDLARIPNVLEPTQVLAVVGTHYIFAGDVLGTVNQAVAPYVEKMPSEELQRQKKMLVARYLPQMIETKLLFVEFLKNVPEDKLPELYKKIGEIYDEKNLDAEMKKMGVTTPGELDAKLRQFGSSLAKQKRLFAETVLAQEVLRKAVDPKIEIPFEDAVAAYRERGNDFDVPAKSRFEVLSVRFDRFASKGEAFKALAQMGNRVLQGAPFAEVAKKSSHDVNADQGGLWDWTSKGALVSKVLDEAIFTLPPGQLSQILEDETSFHIVRVIERREAFRTPFVEAQVKIKEDLRKVKLQEKQQQYMTELRTGTRVWTIFDDQPQPGPDGERQVIRPVAPPR